MINFRYHIVSLVAVFMALAVGIVLGATILGDRLNEGILTQAAADRKTVQDQREELQQLKALDEYRDDYDEKVGKVLTAGVLTGQNVMLVGMPGAPSAVINTVSAAVTLSGGNLTRTVQINKAVFDSEKAGDVNAALEPYAALLSFPPDATLPTKFGLVLARGTLSMDPAGSDQVSNAAVADLKKAKLIVDDGDEETVRAQLVIVVTAAADEQNRATPEALTEHIQVDLALKQNSHGVVLAGPNSTDIQGTDVASARAEAPARDLLSTVDVADLPSGVTSVVLAAREQSLGGQGHYGAQTSRDDIAPALPGG